MISWKVKMLKYFDTTKRYPNSTRGWKYRTIFWPPLPSRYFYLPEIIDDKVLFAVHIYLIRSIIKIVSMISWIVKMLLFWHYQNLSELNPGQNI